MAPRKRAAAPETPPVRPLTLEEAVKAGQRQGLAALRDQLARTLELADLAVQAQIAGQLRAVIKDLAALGDEEKGQSPADEIAARRQARLAGTADPASAAGRRQSGGRRGGNRAR